MNRYGFGIESFYFFFLVFFVIYLVIIKCTIPTNNRITRKKNVILSFIPLFLLGALRGQTVGGDLKNYVPEFEALAHEYDLKSFIMEATHEPGYLLYTRLLGFLSDDPRIFIIGTSILSLIGPCYIIYKLSNRPQLSILIYYIMGFYTNTFNNVRQSLAISLVLISFCMLKDGNFRKFCLGVLIATSFHYSALLAMILYPFMQKEYTFKRLLFISSSGLAIVGGFGFLLFQYIAQFILLKYDPEALLENSEGGGYGMFSLYFILFIFTAFVYFRYRKQCQNLRNFDTLFFLNLIMIAMVIQMSATFFHSMLRMTYYFFIPYMIIGFPYILSHSKGLIKACSRALLIFLLVFFFNNAYKRSNDSDISNSNSQATIPYVFLDTTIF